MPKWCMSCGKAKMPELNSTIKKTKKGIKWKTPSRKALRRKKIVVCGECYRKVSWEA